MINLLKLYFLSWGMLILSVLFNALGVFVIKWRMNQVGAFQYESFLSTLSYFFLLIKPPIVFFSIVLFFIAPFLFAIALSHMEITIAYPVQISLNFLILLLLAVIFLGEKLTLMKGLGIFLILIGIIILTLIK